MPKKKDNNKIEVDKEFLDLILKSNTDLKNKVGELETKVNGYVNNEAPKEITPTLNVEFMSIETVFGDNLNMPEKAVQKQEQIVYFRRQLKELMEKYRVGQVHAVFLARI